MYKSKTIAVNPMRNPFFFRWWLLLGFAMVMFEGRGQTPDTNPVHRKIEALLLAVDSADSLRFIRNGRSYNNKQAAAHFRRKFEKNKERIDSVEAFISNYVSRSSWSGRDYQVSINGKEEISCRDFLLLLNNIVSRKSGRD